VTGDCVRRRARLRRCALTSSCGGSGCNARRSHCCMHVTNSSAPGMRPPAARAIAPAYGQRHPVAFLTSCRGMVQRPETHRRCVRTGSSGGTSLRRTTTAMPYARQKQQRAWYAPTSRSCHRIRCHRWHSWQAVAISSHGVRCARSSAVALQDDGRVHGGRPRPMRRTRVAASRTSTHPVLHRRTMVGCDEGG